MSTGRSISRSTLSGRYVSKTQASHRTGRKLAGTSSNRTVARSGGEEAAIQTPDRVEARYRKNRRAAAQVYIESAERIGREVPERIRRLAEGS